MKYWLMTTEYPPAHGGGISTYCRCTAEMLSARGILVTVIVHDDGIPDHLIERLGDNLYLARFNPGRRSVPRELGGSAGLSYAYFDMLWMLVERLGAPDVIESQDYLGIAYYLQQYRLLGYPPFVNVPVLITMHAPAFVYLPYNRVPIHRFPDFWTGEMEKQSIRAADLVVSPSEFLIREVGRHMDYGPRKPVVLRYAYEPCVQASDFPAEEALARPRIVYYGKLSPQKGSFQLMEYFCRLWEEGFPHPLHIVGGTDIVYQPEGLTMGQVFERRYAGYIRHGLLVFHGKIRPEHIGEALADAHVVLLPSIVDNLPFACLETLACGKIVLASVQGGQREIIRDGENGFLFDHDIGGDFARQLKRILALSGEERRRICENARRTLERYSYETIAPQRIAMLEGLAQQNQPPAEFPFLWQEPVQLRVQEPAAKEPVQLRVEEPADQEPVQLRVQEPAAQDPAATQNARDPAATQNARDPANSGIDGLLSIVIPFYNLGAYLDECIGSILSGCWQQREILVVNDGSTDPKSLAALDRWRDHTGVRIIDQPNRGLSSARNTGARQAAGQYLAFLDADDKVTPEYYNKAIRILKHYPNVHFVGSWVRYFDGATGIWPTFNPAPPYLLAHNPVNSSGLVYKTASFLEAGLNDPRLEYGLEDYDSVIGMVSRGFNGVVLPEPLHLYRVRAGSMIRRMNRNKLLYSHAYIAEKHRAYYQRFAPELIHLLNANGPAYLYENPTREIFVTASIDRPGGWRHRVRRLAHRNRAVKRILLTILKTKGRLWQRQ
ncbi:MAG TPA: glycosyltransferase [Puia sp.]|nr:glycosyltransferase [Puia sp.]